VTDEQHTEDTRSDAIKALIDSEKEANNFIRHYEETRFKITQMTITLSGLLVGALRFGQPNKNTGILFGCFIVILGVLGALISAKYTERADRHAELSRAYRRTASELIGNIGSDSIESIHIDAAAKHSKTGRVTWMLHNLRARYFWIGIHFCMILFGIIVAMTF
jgi:hypothetical protein